MLSRILKKIIGLCECTHQIISKFLEPFYALSLRIYLLYALLPLGWQKVKEIINGSWEGIVFTYKYEYKIPFFSDEFAAAFGTLNEFVFPILIALGFLTRLSSLGVFTCALIIEFTHMHNTNHYIWLIASMYLVIRGAGLFSVDYLIHRLWSPKKR